MNFKWYLKETKGAIQHFIIAVLTLHPKLHYYFLIMINLATCNNSQQEKNATKLFFH